ncbi:hypothetical protein COV81_03215 [Candidatus Peregrinibacteria bacterium CG11_big_fil_rev_8_21_14_0_20_41_10]|nr:MAG: hypothetical protein COV81_03215 [Candidatus Peregrinibacteria bacterium CG11_big_fil_rev_8_21_14_0_20_41_10]PIZ72978.1 MAG: hypothetical protein COY06_05970 [Candidatus Peregrinibacteria bacterium CG_4_10_14_0_2_um_filter_41_8]
MYFLTNIPKIQISPDILFNVGPIAVTNTMLGLLIVNVILLLLVVWVRKGAGLIPSRIQIVIEEIMSFFINTLTAAFGSEKEARRYLPVIITIFIVFLIANQFSILPIISELTSGNDVSLFAVPTKDFSLTIAVALFVVGLANVIALRVAPIKHIGGFIKIKPFLKVRSLSDLGNAGLEFFLGLLDIIGEIAKVVSLSARLFGNVLAGELMVLIITYMASFTNFIIPIPFIFLSAFSGLIHAFVFPLLSVQYLAGTIKSVQPETV